MDNGVGDEQGASPGADTLIYADLALDAAARSELAKGAVGEAVSFVSDKRADDPHAVRVLSARNVDLGALDAHRELVRRRLDRGQPVTVELAELGDDRATLRIDLDGRERSAVGRMRDPVPYDTTRPPRQAMRGWNGILLFGGLAAALVLAIYFNMPDRTSAPLRTVPAESSGSTAP